MLDSWKLQWLRDQHHWVKAVKCFLRAQRTCVPEIAKVVLSAAAGLGNV